jgi:hypothetical protein
MGGLALFTNYFHSCLLETYDEHVVTQQSLWTMFGIYSDGHADERGHSEIDEHFRQYSNAQLQLLGGDAELYGSLYKNGSLGMEEVQAWEKSVEDNKVTRVLSSCA